MAAREWTPSLVRRRSSWVRIAAGVTARRRAIASVVRSSVTINIRMVHCWGERRRVKRVEYRSQQTARASSDNPRAQKCQFSVTPPPKIAARAILPSISRLNGYFDFSRVWHPKGAVFRRQRSFGGKNCQMHARESLAGERFCRLFGRARAGGCGEARLRTRPTPRSDPPFCPSSYPRDPVFDCRRGAGNLGLGGPGGVKAWRLEGLSSGDCSEV